VRATEPGLLEEEDYSSLRSLRFVRPGTPPTQIACRPVTHYLVASPPTSAAIELENTLVTNYSIVGGTRGMIVAGPSFNGDIRLRAIVVFSASIPANGYKG